MSFGLHLARARPSRTRTSSGGRRGGASGPRRTSPPATCPCSAPATAIERDVVEAPDVVRVRELDDVTRSLDVGLLHRLVVGGHVVDGGEVEEVIDLLENPSTPKRRLRQVAGHRHDPVAGIQSLRERLDLAARPLAHERVDGPLPLEQFLDEVPADETCCPGDEVVHRRATLPTRDLTRDARLDTDTPAEDTPMRQAAGWIVGEERATREALDCVASLRRGPLRPLAAGPPRWSRR